MFDPQTISDIFPPHLSVSVTSIRLRAEYARCACHFERVE
jgi:hypothetical protein